MEPRKIIVVIGVLLLLIIMLQNTQIITVNILFWKLDMSQIVLIFMATMIGLLVGYLASALRKGKR